MVEREYNDGGEKVGDGRGRERGNGRVDEVREVESRWWERESERESKGWERREGVGRERGRGWERE